MRVVTADGKTLVDQRQYTGTAKVPTSKKAECRWLLVQGTRKETAPEGWHKVWEGHRPGDKTERLWLYRRD